MMSLHKNALYLALLVLVASIALFIGDLPRIGGPLLAIAFALAAYGVRGSESFRGISFSLLILAAVCLAMNYPAPFVSLGGFRMSTLIVPLLQIIMFGMGTAMSAGDFVGVITAP